MVKDKNDELTTSTDYKLLVIGTFMLLVPLFFIVLAPDQFDRAHFFLRIIAALGGGLIGAFIPGMLSLELPYMKAGGALAVFAVIYGVNPPAVVGSLFSSLENDAKSWVSAAKEARESGSVSPDRPLPTKLVLKRSNFENSWMEARASEKAMLEPRIAYDALNLTARVYRVQEVESENKPSANRWADIAIEYFESNNNTQYLVEALLDKGAIYLEISQIEHTEPEQWQEIATKGDSILSRAFSLASPEQQSDTLRIWSRFFYNLSRPRSGNLTKNWDNNYLLVALDKMEQAYSINPNDPKNATQLARVVQKAAANPPHDLDPEWAVKLRDTQVKLLSAWEQNGEKLNTPSKRIPPLNIIGVLTLNVVYREWEVLSDNIDKNKARLLAEELSNVAMKAQREALSLLPSTEWEEDYDFDMYYDLARMQSVKCRIMYESEVNNAGAECEEALKNMTTAKRKASSIQLNSSRQAMTSDPTLSKVPPIYHNKLVALLESSDI